MLKNPIITIAVLIMPGLHLVTQQNGEAKKSIPPQSLCVSPSLLLSLQSRSPAFSCILAFAGFFSCRVTLHHTVKGPTSKLAQSLPPPPTFLRCICLSQHPPVQQLGNGTFPPPPEERRALDAARMSEHQPRLQMLKRRGTEQK